MWPFKKKRKETPKRYPYRGQASNTSTWDNLSIIEKFVLIMSPIALTFIDCMILEAMFGFVLWVNVIISIISTIVLMILIWLFAGWMVERD